MAKGKEKKGKPSKHQGTGSESSIFNTLVCAGVVLAAACISACAYQFRDYLTLPVFEPAGPATDLLTLGRSVPNCKLNVYSQVYAETGQGLATKQEIRRGDTVIDIPLTHDAYIGSHSLPENFMLLSAKDGLLEEASLAAKQRLMLAILVEKAKSSSRWSALWKIMPNDIGNAITFDEVQRLALKGTDLFQKFEEYDVILNATRLLVQNAKTIFPVAPTEEQLRWALAVTEAKAHLELGDERMLFPFLSLANHHFNQSNTLEYIRGRSSIKFTARKALSRGSQVFLDYGRHSNLRLLTQFGFTMEGNTILEHVPMSLLKIPGADLFKFKPKNSKWPKCRDLIENPEFLRRSTQDVSFLPKLVLQCWRMSKFGSQDEAQKAVDSGMLNEDGKFDWMHNVPATLLVKDAETLNEIAAACAQVKVDYLNVTGDNFFELENRNDDVSVKLRELLKWEMYHWDQCTEAMNERTKTVIWFLERLTKKTT
eukprot:gnl/MRDRNA2_/MRDRNA2_109566_c0_seq1.p1 gnl/MRDRNA2_/MRDRNA2_109566_c0~~gnl/MRDRNA2_/MRDRNA2_109566_c0_seq1.p1  ORF type:complete len:483 (+),score=80.52 gnl/MRDRNA2_/MRDRNA2_109566_c0_seq1:88-1536(+)